MSMIVDAIGAEQAAFLSERVGGLRLSIPLYLSNGDAPEPFRSRVGDDKLAILMILHLGGSTVYVPVSPSNQSNKPVDLATVVELSRKRLSAREIAVRLKCSERCVYAKRAEARSAGLLRSRKPGRRNGVRYARK